MLQSKIDTFIHQKIKWIAETMDALEDSGLDLLIEDFHIHTHSAKDKRERDDNTEINFEWDADGMEHQISLSIVDGKHTLELWVSPIGKFWIHFVFESSDVRTLLPKIDSLVEISRSIHQSYSVFVDKLKRENPSVENIRFNYGYPLIRVQLDGSYFVEFERTHINFDVLSRSCYMTPNFEWVFEPALPCGDLMIIGDAGLNNYENFSLKFETELKAARTKFPEDWKEFTPWKMVGVSKNFYTKWMEGTKGEQSELHNRAYLLGLYP